MAKLRPQKAKSRRHRRDATQLSEPPSSDVPVDFNRAMRKGAEKRAGEESKPHASPLWLQNCAAEQAESIIASYLRGWKYRKIDTGLPKGTPSQVKILQEAGVVGIYETHPGVPGDLKFEKEYREFVEKVRNQ